MSASDAAHTSRSAAYVSWLVWGGTGGALLLIVLGVVGWYLPLWTPTWVVTYSPSFRYAFRALESDNDDGTTVYLLGSRVWQWEGTAARLLRERIENGGVGIEANLLWLMCEPEWMLGRAMESLPAPQAKLAIERYLVSSHEDLLASSLFLLDEPSGSGRGVAVSCLTTLKDPRARQALERHLGEIDHSPQIAMALQEIGDPAAVPAIMRFLANNPTIYPPLYLDVVAVLVPEVPEDVLVTVLGLPSPWARTRALVRLAHKRTSASLPALVRVAVDPVDDVARQALDLLIVSLTDKESDQLVAYITPNDDVLLRGSVRVLAAVGDPRTVSTLITLLVPRDGFVDPQMEALILSCLSTTDDGDLYEALDHVNPTVRAWAARLIGSRHLAAASLALLLHLADPHPEVRAAVLRSLGTLRAHEAFSILKQALVADTVGERVAAVRALGDLGDAAAVTPVRGMLGSPEWRERQAAAMALGQLGDLTVLDAVRPLLSDPEPMVREAARTALERLNVDHAEQREVERLRLEEFTVPQPQSDPRR